MKIKNWVDSGCDFAKTYFRQTTDINLSDIENWKPIGEVMSGRYFNGIYDGNGHRITNMRCVSKDDVGLFGVLGGTIVNLGIVDSYIEGSYCGVFASHASNKNAKIINCYSNSVIRGYRAGGIADDFEGKILNCLNRSSITAFDIGGAVSYTSGEVCNVFSSYDNITFNYIREKNNYGHGNVNYCTDNFLQSEYLLQKLNEFVCDYSDFDIEIDLLEWDRNEVSGYLTLNFQ